jgi:hypothetical protein
MVGGLQVDMPNHTVVLSCCPVNKMQLVILLSYLPMPFCSCPAQFPCPTLAVTLGLPSLSPPIQEPKRKGVAFRGKSFPVCFLSATLSLRMNAGTACHRDCSTMCRPPRASAHRATRAGHS